MLRKYIKNSFYCVLTGGIALGIMKDEKIMDYSANLLEKFSSRYVQNFDHNYSIEEEKNYLNLLVILLNIFLLIFKIMKKLLIKIF